MSYRQFCGNRRINGPNNLPPKEKMKHPSDTMKPGLDPN